MWRNKTVRVLEAEVARLFDLLVKEREAAQAERAAHREEVRALLAQRGAPLVVTPPATVRQPEDKTSRTIYDSDGFDSFQVPINEA